MSKLLIDLMEAERQRKQRAAREAAAATNAPDPERSAMADALARRAADQCASAAAESRQLRSAEQIAVAQRRQQAEDLAAEQALGRAAAEKAAGVSAEQQAQAERLADVAAAREAPQSSAVELEATQAKAPLKSSPAQARRRLLASTALALMAGIGAGIWLGTPPAVSSRLPSGPQDTLRLRLDDTLRNAPMQGDRVIPRD